MIVKYFPILYHLRPEQRHKVQADVDFEEMRLEDFDMKHLVQKTLPKWSYWLSFRLSVLNLHFI